MLILSLTLPLALVFTTPSTLAAPPEALLFDGEAITPLQTELAAALRQRQAAGLPIPEVTFSAEPIDDQTFGALSLPRALATAGATVTAKTTIYFDGPQEAGYDKWPAVDISGDLAGDGTAPFSTGDLTEIIRKGVNDQVPGFWDQVEFGQEARRYSIVENYETAPTSAESRSAMSLSSASQVTQAGDILMGFTYTGPHIDYTVESSLEVCIPIINICGDVYYLKAGFKLDWALGLRLPASATLSGPDQVELGSAAYFQTSLTPQDWAGSQYGGYDVAAEEGNEFVLRLVFFVGLKVEVVGQDLCDAVGLTCSVDIDENYSTSFTTPFGGGTSFPIPKVSIPIYQLGPASFNFSVNLTIDTLVTSTQILADWQGSGNSSGAGTVTYTAPGQPVTFGPVSICNLAPNANQAQIKVDNYRYYFNEFKIAVGIGMSVNIFNVYTGSFSKPIVDLDLSSIFGGLGLYVGDHVQCVWADASNPFVCSRAGPPNKLILTTTTKDETPPVTTLHLAGTAGTNGWYVSDVQFSLNAADTACASGVDKTEYKIDDGAWNLFTGPVMLTHEGITSVYYRSTDKAGNVEAPKSQMVQIDKTPPVITGAPTTLPNSHGWWNEDVGVHFEATDDVSGVAYVTPDVTISTEGVGQSVVGTAVDMAGNSAQFTVQHINLDKTPPVLTILSPLPQTYANTGSITVQWTAADALSGIDTEEGDLDGAPVSNGQLIELRLVAAGEHAVTVVTVDKAGNVTSGNVEFFVKVDIDGLIDSVKYMCQVGWIDSSGICNSLLAKLNNARRDIVRGQCNASENVLRAFINEVEAVNKNWLADGAANVLKTDALYVIQLLPCRTASP